jgi:type II secretory pathway pseudopilin PulG
MRVSRRARDAAGLTLLETMFTIALLATVLGFSVPILGASVDDHRTAMAARYLAGRLGRARMDAVKRSTATALRFQSGAPDYTFTPYADGNDNGLRTADINAGIDRPIGVAERLADNYPGVRFGLLPGVPDADGSSGTGTDGVRIGSSRILTLSPDGTATAGTLYIQGRRAQYAVRVLGVTGRVRVLKYEAGVRRWISR